MTWTSEPQNLTRPAVAGWFDPSNLPAAQPNSIPGWFAIIWLLAEAKVQGITAKADLEVLLEANAEVLGLNATGQLSDFYQDTSAIAGPIEISPKMVVDVVAQAISQGIEIDPRAANFVMADATADDINIVVGEWISVVAALAQGSVNLSSALAQLQVSSLATSGPIALSANAINAYPSMGPISQTFSSVGTQSYTIPYWSKYIDLVGKGAGCGGRGGGAVLAGGGGGTGQWNGVTLERGVDIPWDARNLEVVVSDGSNGSAGAIAVVVDPPTPAACTVKYSGTTLLSVAGGAPNQSGQNGQDGGSFSYQGVLYSGGGGGTGNGGNGSAPGGGGAGGNGDIGFLPGSQGGKGGAGRIWCVARQ